MPCSPASGDVASTTSCGLQRLSETQDRRRTRSLYGGKAYRQNRYASCVPTSMVSPALMSRKSMRVRAPALYPATWALGLPEPVAASLRAQAPDAFLVCLSLPFLPLIGWWFWSKLTQSKNDAAGDWFQK